MKRLITTIGLLAAFAFLSLLSACAETPRAIVQDKIVTETVPVAVQPIKPADIPVPPPALGPRPPSAQQAADAAFAAHCRDVAFVIDAFPLLRLSAGLPPAQAPDYPECTKR